LHVINGLRNPLENKLRLELVLKGINRVKPHQSCPRLSVTVTPVILSAIKQVINNHPSFDSIMLWASCYLGFFWDHKIRGVHCAMKFFLRQKQRHLTAADMAVNNHTSTTMLDLTL